MAYAEYYFFFFFFAILYRSSRIGVEAGHTECDTRSDTTQTRQKIGKTRETRLRFRVTSVRLQKKKHSAFFFLAFLIHRNQKE